MICVDVHGNVCTKKNLNILIPRPDCIWFELDLFLYYSGKFGSQLIDQRHRKISATNRSSCCQCSIIILNFPQAWRKIPQILEENPILVFPGIPDYQFLSVLPENLASPARSTLESTSFAMPRPLHGRISLLLAPILSPSQRLCDHEDVSYLAVIRALRAQLSWLMYVFCENGARQYSRQLGLSKNWLSNF